jgi:hypothetical protein
MTKYNYSYIADVESVIAGKFHSAKVVGSLESENEIEAVTKVKVLAAEAGDQSVMGIRIRRAN